MDLEIKIYADPSDGLLDQIASLHNEYFPSSQWNSGYLKKFFSKTEKRPVLCSLEERGTAKGFVLGKKDKGNGFLIHSFLISEDSRGKGWGERLMKTICKRVMEDMQIEYVSVNFRAGNPVEKLYFKLGFSDFKFNGQYKNGEAKVSMRISMNDIMKM